MKMISIDDLIEYCDSERTAYKANNCGAACTALRRLVEFAKEYAVEAEPVDRWISVKDRLPPTGVPVLIYVYKIKDGDEVILDDGTKGVVVFSSTDGHLNVVNAFGGVRSYIVTDVIKTGRHFPQMVEMMKEMRNNDEPL